MNQLFPKLDHLKADTIAAASAEFGLQAFGAHLPTQERSILRQSLYDLCYVSIEAYVTLPPCAAVDRRGQYELLQEGT